MENPITENTTKTSPQKRRSMTIVIVLLILLIGSQVWSYVKITKLEKAITLQSEQIGLVSADLSSAQIVISTQATQIGQLIVDLSYATSLAENANSWAHSHY